MSEKRIYRLVHDEARKRAANDCMRAEHGFIVTVEEPSKTREQEARYHAMFSDFSKQCEFMGQKWTAEDWKRLLVDSFARVMASNGTPLSQGGRIVPALDGAGFVQLGIQTRKFRKKEASEFIEYLFAFGAEQGVKWSHE
jgi:hypothetical protein